MIKYEKLQDHRITKLKNNLRDILKNGMTPDTVFNLISHNLYRQGDPIEFETVYSTIKEIYKEVK